MTTPMTRRAILTGAAATAATMAGMRSDAQPVMPEPVACSEPPAIILNPGATVLMQGDSITDAGRKKDNLQPNAKDALGKGYASLIAYHLLTKHKDLELNVYNRGISGNKVPDLDKRWERDCIELKPDVLSIMIGINDIWHMKQGRYDGTTESYAVGFKALLQRTQDALPQTQFVICEPFLVRAADGSTKPDWFPEFDDRRAKAKEAADSVGAVWVPFQAMFDDAIAAGTPHKHWSGDTVHVNSNGAALMAMRWLSETGLG